MLAQILALMAAAAAAQGTTSPTASGAPAPAAEASPASNTVSPVTVTRAPDGAPVEGGVVHVPIHLTLPEAN